MREAVYALAGHPKQYIHVQLASGKVLKGTISNANNNTFLVSSTYWGPATQSATISWLSRRDQFSLWGRERLKAWKWRE
ncbi:MAG TPA: hypothetical protein VKH63_01525 [Candidatus Acidoferrum sp.]|nr:hypothetical protein [Candidatus Acidoferrum sp.]